MKVLHLLTLITGIWFLQSCNEKPPAPTYNPDSNEVVVHYDIKENTTWTKDKVYVLNNYISVKPGNTLTIEAGTIIKGGIGSDGQTTALVIEKGAQIFAKGTAQEPIIFTALADQIQPGEIESPNLDANEDGLWGGLVILGEAKVSDKMESSNITSLLPLSDRAFEFGGDNETDNSGVLEYVSIRHAGAKIEDGSLSGLTLGGVGSGTSIHHIEVIGCKNDGIKWIGGAVSLQHILVWNADGDAIDTRNAWSGTLDNFIVINPGDECFEVGGPEAAYEAKHTIQNGSVYAENSDGLIDLDDNSWVHMNNIYFFGLWNEQDFDLTSTDFECTFENLQASIPDGFTLTDFFKGGAAEAATEVAIGANTVGASKSVFVGWSWAESLGTLADF